jgi:hypothetical protein
MAEFSMLFIPECFEIILQRSFFSFSWLRRYINLICGNVYVCAGIIVIPTKMGGMIWSR